MDGCDSVLKYDRILSRELHGQSYVYKRSCCRMNWRGMPGRIRETSQEVFTVLGEK